MTKFDTEVDEYTANKSNYKYIRPKYEGLCWEVRRESKKAWHGGIETLQKAKALTIDLWGV